MTPLHCVISNFEEKKSCIVNKRLFLPKFSQLQVFVKNVVLCKKWKLKGNSIELSVFLKYGLTEVTKALSRMFDLVLNMPL